MKNTQTGFMENGEMDENEIVAVLKLLKGNKNGI